MCHQGSTDGNWVTKITRLNSQFLWTIVSKDIFYAHEKKWETLVCKLQAGYLKCPWPQNIFFAKKNVAPFWNALQPFFFLLLTKSCHFIAFKTCEKLPVSIWGEGLFLIWGYNLLCMHVYKELMPFKSVCDIKLGVVPLPLCLGCEQKTLEIKWRYDPHTCWTI